MKREPGFGLESVITSFTVFGNGCLARYLGLPPLARREGRNSRLVHRLYVIKETMFVC